MLTEALQTGKAILCPQCVFLLLRKIFPEWKELHVISLSSSDPSWYLQGMVLYWSLTITLYCWHFGYYSMIAVATSVLATRNLCYLGSFMAFVFASGHMFKVAIMSALRTLFTEVN